MSKDKRTGWLADLQVGDRVFMYSRYVTRVSEVEKITPTGRIVVDNITFTHEGRQYSGQGYNTYSLKEFTKEEYDKFIVAVYKSKNAKIIADTTQDILMKLPLETLKNFVEAIEECMED